MIASGGVGFAAPSMAHAQTFTDLRQMSLDQLSQVDISSVTKAPQAIGVAPASVYVISNNDIERSGATTIPEALRLAPNLVVARQSSSQYVVSARGLSGSPAAQNFANKLLVLIDGRSVYTPLFSGVYWDMQDVVLADVDRIEVISGPGATLWGANAVNGVINIITKSAGDSAGILVEASGGTLERSGTLRYGGQTGGNLAYRVYLRGIEGDATRTASGASGEDDRWRVQGGFRLDWTASEQDQVTLQGDAYQGSRGQAGSNDERIVGRNVLARWNRSIAADANLQVQAYYDRTVRHTVNGGGRFALDTYDFDAQQSFPIGTANAVVFGGGVRASRYRIQGANGLDFDPAAQTLWLANVFVQDTAKLAPHLDLTVGVKIEKDPLTAATPLPSARVAWTPRSGLLIWGAVSRAIRSATPFDRDVRESVGPTLFLTGAKDFAAEKLVAFELGTRLAPNARFSISVTGFRHVYDDLKTVEPAPGGFVPLRWGNGLGGTIWGLESWGDWQALDWWKLSASFTIIRKTFSFDPSASGLIGISQLGADPEHKASLRSSMELGRGVTLDAALRRLGPASETRLRPYLELDTRLGWAIDDRVMLAITGANLLHRYHQEYAGETGNLIPRQVSASLQWRW
ncbi:MAG TPA: TonB-dependent receptor [Sphingomonas sp.]|nr:TonB-dependent receptor [Sphingomonas sp.]